MKRILLLSLVFALFYGCAAFKPSRPTESIYSLPVAQREFRAVWVATVANIDWPSEPGLPVDIQKQEAIAILDTVQKLNMNAVIFQVRPQCDAFYPSKLEPWSYYLTGVQGQAPQPFYDPLKFWIEQAHQRGLELHAWFNPYRAHHPKGGPVTEASIVTKRPDLAKKLTNGYYWLDPANPGTQEHSLQVVMDVVQRYDVDGIHFDDYFYPYPSYNANRDFPDEDSWQAYLRSGGTLSRGDWRRDAVNTFIKRLYAAIKKEKPWVKFGLSPFGIYRPHHPAAIKGFDQYNVLYADARLWLQNGWVDYFTPQLYWPINRFAQSYPLLLGWWTRQNPKGRHIWPGLYTSKVTDSLGVDENLNQIMIERGMVPNDPGEVHFSVKAFMDSTQTLNRALVQGPYARKALVPASPWLALAAPQAPSLSHTVRNDTLFIQRNADTGNELFLWVVYYQTGKEWDYQILNRTQTQFRLPLAPSAADTDAEAVRAVRVTAVNRSGNESAAVKVFSAH